MYVAIEDPENPGRRLYADLIIREKVLAGGSLPPTEIIDIEVMDTCIESDFSASVAASLRGVKIQSPALLQYVLREHCKLFRIPNELLEAIRAKMEEVGCVVE